MVKWISRKRLQRAFKYCVAGLNLGFFGQSATVNQRVAAVATDLGVLTIPPIELVLTGAALATRASTVPDFVPQTLLSQTSLQPLTTITSRSTATNRAVPRETSRTVLATTFLAITATPAVPLEQATSATAARSPTASVTGALPATTDASQAKPDSAGLASSTKPSKPTSLSRTSMIIVGSAGAVLALASILGVWFYIQRRRRARFDEKMFCRGDSLEKSLTEADKAFGGLSRKVSKKGKELKIQRLWQRQEPEKQPDSSSFNLLAWRHVAGLHTTPEDGMNFHAEGEEAQDDAQAIQSEERDAVADILHRYTDPAESRGFSSLYSTDGDLPIVLGSPVRTTSPWFQWQQSATEPAGVSYGLQRSRTADIILNNDVAGGRVKSVRPVAEQSKFSLSDYSNDYRQTQISFKQDIAAARQSKRPPRNTETNFSVKSGVVRSKDVAAEGQAIDEGFLQRYVKKAWGRS